MNSALWYPISHIVIGQSPYPSQIIPFLGAAFSQKEFSENTPTTSIFGLHFQDKQTAMRCIRNSWQLLNMGYFFVNADYSPSNMGGGSCDIDSVRRISRMSEFIFYSVVHKNVLPKRITILSIGNVATFCGSSVSKRLRVLGVTVDHITCKQPSSLQKIEFNKHLIGIDQRYMFCRGRCHSAFYSMISKYSDCCRTKVRDCTSVAIKNMNQNKIAPMTKVALESIAGDLKNLVERLNAEKAPPVQINDVQHHLNDMNESIIQLTKAVVDLTNLLLGDAYTYRTIIESESVQVPVASREQHISGIVDQGSEVNSTVSLPTGLSVKSRSGNKDKVANMFKSRVVSTPSATPSRPSNVSSSDHHSTPLQHPPSTDQKLKRPPNSFKSPAKDLFNSKTTKTPSVKVAAKSSNLSKSKKMFTELARDAKLKEDQYFDILDVNHEDNDVADLL